MATRLTKPVAREIVTRGGTPLIVTLTEFGVSFREKGRREKNAVLLPYGVGFIRATDLAVAARRREKAANRAAKRKGY